MFKYFSAAFNFFLNSLVFMSKTIYVIIFLVVIVISYTTVYFSLNPEAKPEAPYNNSVYNQTKASERNLK